ncbi:MAG TPA: hypothetical protein PKC18_07735 [Lacipirellulaceae bacterium]|nr:hypothetical protein [Lacipirellulaceae bacterium]
MNVDFYEVEGWCPGATISRECLAEVLRHLWNRQNGEPCQTEVGGELIRLRFLQDQGDLLFGDVAKLRFNEPVRLAHVSGREWPATKDRDEGPSESAAFLYAPSRRVLAYQRNKSGPSCEDFRICVMNLSATGEIYRFLPIIRRSLVEDLLNRKPRALKCRVALPKLATEAPGALGAVISAADILHAPELRIEFGFGRRAGKLDAGKVVEFVRQALMLGNQGARLDKLEATAGSDEGHKSQVLKFLDAVLTSPQTIPRTNLPHEDDKHRQSAVLAAFNAVKPDLRVYA